MPAQVYGGQGLALTISCDVHAEPAVSHVTWRKNGHLLTTKAVS